MIETLILLPFTFWAAIILFLLGGLVAVRKLRCGLGIPMLAILATVFFWYVGDVMYNDYPNYLHKVFSDDVLSIAWLEVCSFLLAFLIFVKLLNRKSRRSFSNAYLLYRGGINYLEIQLVTKQFFKICLVIWCVLVVFAFIIIGGKAVWYVLPILGQKVNPFARGQIGGGMSAFYSLAQYFYILVGAGFGVVAAMTKDRRIFRLAIIGCILVWPYFILDRTRSSMVAVCLPGILVWIFYRLQTSNKIRIVFLCVVLLIFNIWFMFVMGARSQGRQVADSFFQSSAGEIVQSGTRHLGLNMYEELCWLTSFIKRGTFQPNWGKRYFAELVNPVPRALWPGKPTIGLDYAVARGQDVVDHSGTVSATISTGMIGQGVNNFGIFFGPIAAAFLMALWATILAKIDTGGRVSLRQPLYCIGLVLTFNFGRDITLLGMYPFFFGWLAILIAEGKLLLRRKRFAW